VLGFRIERCIFFFFSSPLTPIFFLLFFFFFSVGRSYLYAFLGWPDPDVLEAARWRAKSREDKRKRAAIVGAHGVKTSPAEGDSPAAAADGGAGKVSRRQKGKETAAATGAKESGGAAKSGKAESKKDQ
jgi:hypothetical protein